MHTMDELERLAKEASEAFDQANARISDFDAEVAALKRRRLVGIRNAIAKAIETRAALREAVAENPDLFNRPKSRTIHGMRFGWEKGKGKITYTDPEGVCRLIKRHFPDQVEVLIKTTEKPVKKALQQLPTRDLKRVGCEVQETDDAPFVRMVDSELEKFLNNQLDDEELDLAAA